MCRVIRQSRDISDFIARNRARTGESEAVIRDRIQRLIDEAAEVGDRVRPAIVELAHRHNLPLLSHDDTEPDHVTQAVSEGIAISEFPCTVEAARLARAHGMAIVAGAPNVLRGRSQSGNVAVRDLLAEGLVDMLASDYVPRSLFDSAFMMAADGDVAHGLPQAIAMVSKVPAETVGLTDRGEIAIGKRADLLQVGIHDGHPYLKQIWRAGRRVL